MLWEVKAFVFGGLVVLSDSVSADTAKELNKVLVSIVFIGLVINRAIL